MGDDIPPQSIAVRIERPARPTIWLDTSALINIAKARGGRPQNEADRQRVSEIDRVVADKVRSGRLLCIESEQRHEVRESGLNLVMDVIESLSLGARIRPQLAVQYGQFEIAMHAYLERANSFLLPLHTFFDDNPVQVVDTTSRRGWRVTVRMPEHKAIRDHRQQMKQELSAEWEKLRQRNVAERVTFDQQLEWEAHGTWQGLLARLREALEAPQMGQPPSFWNWMGSVAVFEVANMWRSLGGEPRALGQFFSSDYLRALPYQDIQSRICASLLTGHEPIKSGDSGDIEHLALVLPIASFVLTDNRMARRVQALGLDDKWGARVFSLSSTEQFLLTLSAL
jgi:hypothetical protein